MEIRFTLNGRTLSLEAPPDRRVVDLLRENLGLTGTKEGCGSGECGACTILVDGEGRLACLMLAAQLEGKEVATIEGLADQERLRPLPEAFVRCGAVQCGFCSPGMVLSAAALLVDTPDPSREEIREGLSGNLCRCTGYQKIIDAVEEAAAQIRPDGRVSSPLGSDDQGAAPSGEPERKGGPAGSSPLQAKGIAAAPLCQGTNPARRVLIPASLPELWTLMGEEPEAPLFAGGTDLFVKLRKERGVPPALIGLERIAELQGIRKDKERLWIGACTTHRRLLKDPLIRRHLPILIKALEGLGSPQIRTMGTIGGNICTASPAGDTLPPLWILDAEVELLSAKGRRVVPLPSFLQGPGKTGIEKGEVLAAVTVAIPTAYPIHHFEKIGRRKSMACAVASLASLIRPSRTGVIEAVRLAWGSVGPTVVTAPEVEQALLGEKLSLGLLEEVACIARRAVSPIDDVRASAAYRREVSGNLLLRLASLLS